jgi:hypothetical protein
MNMVEGQEAMVLFAAAAAGGASIGYASKGFIA